MTVTRGDTLAGLVCLRWQISGLHDFEVQPVSLLRLCCLHHRRRLLISLYPPEQRAQRWVRMLRAWDERYAGASQRDIAAALFGDRAAAMNWDAGYNLNLDREEAA